MDLKVVVYRKSETFTFGHILCRGYSHAFCGDRVPEMLVTQFDDPRNPYVGKGKVSCEACLAEWNSGRRAGHRNMEVPEADTSTDTGSEAIPGTQ